MLAQLSAAAELGPAEEFFPISAATGDGVGQLRDALVERLPAGPAYFPLDVVSDQPEWLLVGELIREQALGLMREEVPHALAVRVLGMEQRASGAIVDIEAVIITETKSQKGIVIGQRGTVIKEIGMRARREIQSLLGSHVFLDLRVQVKKKWRQDERTLGDLGI